MPEKGYLHRTPQTFGKLPEALLHGAGISDGAKVLYAHMHWRYGANGRNFEGQRSMAEMLGVSSRETIRKRIEELERAEWIVVIRRGKRRGQYTTNFYHVFESQDDCRAWKARHAQDSGHGHAQKIGHGHAQNSGHYLDSGYLDTEYLDTELSARADARAGAAPSPSSNAVQASQAQTSQSDKKRTSRPRARDPIFDALAECGFSISSGTTIGRSIGARIGKVRAELLATLAECPPNADEIRAAYQWWKRVKKLSAPRDATAVAAMIGEYRQRRANVGGQTNTGRGAGGGNSGTGSAHGGGDEHGSATCTFFDDEETDNIPVAGTK